MSLSRRWSQYSIRSLLFVMVLASVYFAGWASNEWRHQNNTRSPQAVTKTAPVFVTLTYNPAWDRLRQIENGMKADELEMRHRIEEFDANNWRR